MVAFLEIGVDLFAGCPEMTVAREMTVVVGAEFEKDWEPQQDLKM